MQSPMCVKNHLRLTREKTIVQSIDFTEAYISTVWMNGWCLAVKVWESSGMTDTMRCRVAMSFRAYCAHISCFPPTLAKSLSELCEITTG